MIKFCLLEEDVNPITEYSNIGSNNEGSSNEATNINEDANDKKEDTKPQNNKKKTTSIEKSNSDFEGTKVLPNGMEARKGNVVMK